MKTLLLGLAFFSAATRAETFNYQELERLIKQNDVKTVEQLLPLLPESYRKFYLFVYESRSAQAGNTFVEWPRVILYGPDSKFVMAFTKNPATEPATDGADTVETMQYNDATAGFEFRELVFGNGTNPVATPPQVNPAKCQACHGKDVRPNWDPYNTWAGSFGSVSRLSCDTMQSGTEEMRLYQNFLAGNRKKDRYAFLPAEIAIPKNCPHDVNTETTFVNAMHADANALFTQQLTTLNYKRLVRLVKSSPRYERFRPFLTAMVKGCATNPNLDSFFPAGFAAAGNHRSLPEWETYTVDQARLDFGQRLQRFQKNNGPSATNELRRPINFMDDKDPMGTIFSHRYTVARMRLMADRMKLNISKWAMAFTDGEMDFTTPTGDPQNFFDTLSDSLPFSSATCEELKTASVAALGQ